MTIKTMPDSHLVCTRCRQTKQRCNGCFPCSACQLHAARLRQVNAVDLCVFGISPAVAERTAAVLQDVLASCLLQRLRCLGEAEKAGLDRIKAEEESLFAASSKRQKKQALSAHFNGAASNEQQLSGSAGIACSANEALARYSLKVCTLSGRGGH